MEQLSMNLKSEKELLIDEIKNKLSAAINDVELSKYLSVERLGEDKLTGISVKAKSSVVIRLQFRAKSKSFVEFRIANSKFFSTYRVLENNDEWNKIELDKDSDILDMIEPIAETYMRTLLIYERESFGCCSRYEECSNAMKCVHPSKITAQGCQYKIQLEQGNIFYGKNKNC